MRSKDRSRSWKAEWSVQTNFGDIAILSLSKKNLYHSQKNGLCLRRWSHLFLARVHTIRDQKHNGISSLTERVYIHGCIEITSAESWKLYREIVLCYLLFLEVYTHLYLGLHCCDESSKQSQSSKPAWLWLCWPGLSSQKFKVLLMYVLEFGKLATRVLIGSARASSSHTALVFHTRLEACQRRDSYELRSLSLPLEPRQHI